MDTSGSFDPFDTDNEVSQVLSTALDNRSQINGNDSYYSTDDEDTIRNYDNRKRIIKHRDMNGNNNNNNNNYYPSSTPMHSQNLKPQNGYSSNHNMKTPSKYSSLNDGKKYENVRTKISPKVNGFSKQKENINSNAGSLLLENDELSKNFFSLQDKCKRLSGDYEELQKRFVELSQVNDVNLVVIDKLQARVRKLESVIEEETYKKNSALREAEILKASVNSLESALQEYSHSDFYAKKSESHQRSMEALKQKHDRELNSFRKEIDSLKEKLQEKDEEIDLQTSICENTKKIIYREIQDKMERELKSKIEVRTKELIEQFDEKITDLKNNWQVTLLDDVEKIILWLDESVHKNNMGPTPVPNDVIHFESLRQLCDYLNSYLKEREQRIHIQITEFRKTKQQLEDALIQSKMASCDITERSLLSKLESLKEENDKTTYKLKQYKNCYQALLKAHEELKEEHKQIVQESTDK